MTSVTDMVSYYTLPSTVMNHEVHKSIKAAYSFYNVSFKTKWVDLMQDALITAKNVSFFPVYLDSSNIQLC
jgi:N-myristoyl transferase